MSRSFRVAVAGATGLVGRKLLGILERRGFPFSEIVPFGSTSSEGRVLHVGGRPCRLEVLPEGRAGRFDAVFFAAPPGVARRLAPAFAEAGAVVVDVSGDWRLDPGVPLAVPDVQPPPKRRPGIVAGPSSPAILLSPVLRRIREAAGVRRGWALAHLPICTGGRKALEEFEDGLRMAGTDPDPDRVLSFTDRYLGEAPGGEEVAKEVLKVLGDASVPLDISCFRVPVSFRTGVVAYFETLRDCSPEAILEGLRRFSGAGPEEGAAPVVSLRLVGGPSPGFSLRLAGDGLFAAALNAVRIAEVILLGS